MAIPPKDFHDEERGQKLKEKQRQLRDELKKAGQMRDTNIKLLQKQHCNRRKLLRTLNIDVKRALIPMF